MSRPAFDALDRSWIALARRPEATEAIERWRHLPELAAASFDELIEVIWTADPATADRSCAALAALAGRDELAARVLLQVLRPGLRSLGRRLALGGSFDDVDHEILALAWERIRTYPIDRRPAAIAANILLDVRKWYLRSVMDPSGGAASLDHLPDSHQPVAPSAEHEALEAVGPSLRCAQARLRTAVVEGTITPLSAAVVWRTRVVQEDDAAVARSLGVEVRTMQRRRQRAERLLAQAS
jgi:hypothetical protein